MLAYTERMKVVGKAFMRVMGDVLGEQKLFAALQEDNYWCGRRISWPDASTDDTQGFEDNRVSTTSSRLRHQ